MKRINWRETNKKEVNAIMVITPCTTVITTWERFDIIHLHMERSSYIQRKYLLVSFSSPRSRMTKISDYTINLLFTPFFMTLHRLFIILSSSPNTIKYVPIKLDHFKKKIQREELYYPKRELCWKCKWKSKTKSIT